MSYIIRLLEETHGANPEYEGQAVVRCDLAPMANGAPPILVTTPYEVLAKRFETEEAALAYWRQEAPVPREDGQPNRPLTAWTIAVVNIGE